VHNRHALSEEEKLAYISAEKCLMESPAKLGFAGAKTRFDELQKVHVILTPSIHFVVRSFQNYSSWV
jgi:tyrosinase